MSIKIPLPVNFLADRDLSDSASSLTGTITAVPAANNGITVTIPAGGPMTLPATADGTLYWDSGLLVSDIYDMPIKLVLSDVTIAGGTSADAVLGIGIGYSASGVPNLGSDDYAWFACQFGLATADNTTCNSISRGETNAIVSGNTTLNFVDADFCMRHWRSAPQRENYLGTAYNASTHDLSLRSDTATLTSTHRVYYFVLFGRSAAEGSPIDVTFKLSVQPRG